jgi:cytochrome c-type biogenesis protein CcmE
MSEEAQGSEPEEEIPNEPEPESEIPNESPRKPKRGILSTTRGRLVIVIVIVGIALAIGLWGAAPEGYITLEEVAKNSNSYQGKEIEVVGKVGNWTGGLNFTLVGRSDENVSMFVIHEKEIPDGFAEGKDVVVKGKLDNGADELTFRSTYSIQVGCPSKYE